MRDTKKRAKKKSRARIWIFPGVVAAFYVALYLFHPEKVWAALASFAHLAGQIAFPLGMVLGIIFLMNLFLSPDKILRFLGKEAGTRGYVISAIAGIISVGPIFAWYPLLKDLREKGVSSAVLATFLCNRSVKPFLIPIMLSFFGWKYVLVLTIWTILGAVAVGMGVGVLSEQGPPRS